MKAGRIQFRKGYKYSLWEPYDFQTRITGHEFSHHLFTMNVDGFVGVRADYPWDGPSGPTWDTANSMRASLEHDVLFEMMRLEFLPQSCFLEANLQLYHTAVADGMYEWRAKLWLAALNKFGRAACRPQPEAIRSAP